LEVLQSIAREEKKGRFGSEAVEGNGLGCCTSLQSMGYVDYDLDLVVFFGDREFHLAASMIVRIL
jgi:hypothetical protein